MASPAAIAAARQPAIDTDIALPLDLVPEFYDRIHARLPGIDPGCETLSVCHLGDGNVHFTVFPTREGLYDTVVEAVEDVVEELHGSFSAHSMFVVSLAYLPPVRTYCGRVSSVQAIGSPFSVATEQNHNLLNSLNQFRIRH